MKTQPVPTVTYPMIVPTVHLNGTSRDVLIRQISAAHAALDAALVKLGNAAPHGRDYYVQDNPDAYRLARAAHESRMQRVSDVMAEILAIGMAI